MGHPRRDTAAPYCCICDSGLAHNVGARALANCLKSTLLHHDAAGAPKAGPGRIPPKTSCRLAKSLQHKLLLKGYCISRNQVFLTESNIVLASIPPGRAGL
jgi:hypothetical protein